MGVRIIGNRPDTQNPNSGRSPLALRRICGVCQHFQGDSIVAVGRCARLGRDALSGRARASDCEYWGRRTVAPGQGARMRPVADSVQKISAGVPSAKPYRTSAAVPLEDRLKQYPILASEGLTLPQAAARLNVRRATIVRDLWKRGLRWTVLRGDHNHVVSSIECVTAAVADVFGVSVDQMRGRSRTADVSAARGVAFVLALDMTDSSARAVGRYFDGRNGKTVSPVAEAARRNVVPKRADDVARARALAVDLFKGGDGYVR